MFSTPWITSVLHGDKIKPNVIKNCFWKAAFDVWNVLEVADSSPLKDEDFQTLLNFPDYATVDDDLVDSCTWISVEMFADAMTMVNAKEEDSKQEEENG